MWWVSDFLRFRAQPTNGNFAEDLSNHVLGALESAIRPDPTNDIPSGLKAELIISTCQLAASPGLSPEKVDLMRDWVSYLLSYYGDVEFKDANSLALLYSVSLAGVQVCPEGSLVTVATDFSQKDSDAELLLLRTAAIMGWASSPDFTQVLVRVVTVARMRLLSEGLLPHVAESAAASSILILGALAPWCGKQSQYVRTAEVEVLGLLQDAIKSRCVYSNVSTWLPSELEGADRQTFLEKAFVWQCMALRVVHGAGLAQLPTTLLRSSWADFHSLQRDLFYPVPRLRKHGRSRSKVSLMVSFMTVQLRRFRI